MSVDNQFLVGMKDRCMGFTWGNPNAFTVVGRWYLTPNGRQATAAPATKQIALGFRGRIIRVTANVLLNTKTVDQENGVSVEGVDSGNLLTIPAGVTGQFDSGLLASPVEFAPDDRISLWFDHIGAVGNITMERVWFLAEVLGLQ